MVDPLCFAAETARLRHTQHVRAGVFVAALGPDSFAFLEDHRQIRFFYGDPLPALGSQMHFDAARDAVETGHMFEIREIEVAVQLAIDASQQI